MAEHPPLVNLLLCSGLQRVATLTHNLLLLTCLVFIYFFVLITLISLSTVQKNFMIAMYIIFLGIIPSILLVLLLIYYSRHNVLLWWKRPKKPYVNLCQINLCTDIHFNHLFNHLTGLCRNRKNPNVDSVKVDNGVGLNNDVRYKNAIDTDGPIYANVSVVIKKVDHDKGNLRNDIKSPVSGGQKNGPKHYKVLHLFDRSSKRGMDKVSENIALEKKSFDNDFRNKDTRKIKPKIAAVKPILVNQSVSHKSDIKQINNINEYVFERDVKLSNDKSANDKLENNLLNKDLTKSFSNPHLDKKLSISNPIPFKSTETINNFKESNHKYKNTDASVKLDEQSKQKAIVLPTKENRPKLEIIKTGLASTTNEMIAKPSVYNIRDSGLYIPGENVKVHDFKK